ncbi:MAG: sodium/proline symporter [bacterium]|nr:sodium/proline symporter [bacterium]
MPVYDKLSHPVALIIFLITLFLPVLIGFLALKKTKNQSDFLIGGRTVNKFVVALSAVSSGRSSWLVLGVSGMAYTLGTGAVWAVVGISIVEMFQFLFIGTKLRVQSEKFGSLTLLDYFESRYNDKKHMIRITGAVIIIIFMTAYLAAQFNAGARSLSTALDLPFIITLLFSGLIILVYMVLGGYIAVSYNDAIRSMIMIFGLVVFPVYGLIKIGGFSALLEILQNLNPAYIDPFSLGAGVIIGYIGIGLGSPGQPHIVVRYMSIDDPRKLRTSTVIGTFWNVLMGWGAVFIGLIGRALIQTEAELPNQDPEMVYLVLSGQFFNPVIYGLLIGGIFAAILSTADSQLLVVASTVVRDIYEKIIHRGSEIDESHKLRLSRITVVVTGIAAMALAYSATDLIFWLVLFAWGGLGAAFGAALIFSLYWKKTTKYGVTAGMITGALVTIIWKVYLAEPTGLYELIPASICSAAVVVVVSLMTHKK